MHHPSARDVNCAGKVRVLTNSKFGLFYSNFLILTPTFSKVPIEKYGKTPFFSGKQHFYSYFQNPSENSGKSPPVQKAIKVNTATCLAADQCLRVASSIPAGYHAFVEIDHKIMSTVILLLSADSRGVVVSYK